MTSAPPEVGPRPGTWHLDPLHSSLIFVAHYLRYGRVQGTFGRAEGQVVVAENPAESSVEVTLEAGSINTGVGARDAHLRSADFLDVDHHPEIHFVSTGFEQSRRGRYAFRLYGDLTIHGTTVPVALNAQWVGESPDYVSPEDTYGHFFSATTQISLSDFGVGLGSELPWGGTLVGENVDIVLEVRLQNQDPAPFLKQIGHAP
ncbi:YceI family protein [Nocardiopsis aegyptia]|uniref:Polyisoprenoid-binding protein YceI n=1 Tax=Nocardiopsis aegyptia TaxID=220378 RepID=A0A7Z0EPR9_9ACTN|nr:YceI family protein [Nocardiopsis aegyptia]NYJ36026.1 polyisoprenoid-binding protein YceI [Nocardiopsis aegyptia]